MAVDDAYAVSEIRKYLQKSIGTKDTLLVSVVVHHFSRLCAPLLADHPFNTGHVSVFYRQICENILTRCEYDSQFGESDSLALNSFFREDPSLTKGIVPPDTPLVLNSDKRALLRRLISRAVPEGELVSLIEAIFSGEKVSDIVRCVEKNEAQTFINVIDEVRHNASYRLSSQFNFLHLDRH